MVQGASSWAGKSFLTTALARSFARRGLRVAPFKAMNMSNNARVVDGGEMAVAQYLQALAARATPDVRMNPVLVKPEAETQSQVVLMGRVDPELSRTAWRGRTASIWPVIEEAYRSLAADHDLIVIEGAGSPAETNLRDTDVANMRTAKLAEAGVLLVADIDRGGAFAHLYGTWALLPEDERALLAGFVLNRFRGDASLLAPAPDDLAAATGVPVLGVVPWLRHGLPDEDGAAISLVPQDGAAGSAPVVAVVRYPTASNLDEFKPLEAVTHLRWAWGPGDLAGADLVILPGSKHVAADLAWLREQGFEPALRDRAAGGGRILGICGGLQMLGERIDDAAGVDGSADGLGLLPLRTTFEADKRTERARVTFGLRLPEPWSTLAGRSFDGYEIRHGRTAATADGVEVAGDGLAFAREAVLGCYVHGGFEDAGVLEALVGVPAATGSLDDRFDAVADAVEAHLDLDRLAEIAGV